MATKGDWAKTAGEASIAYQQQVMQFNHTQDLADRCLASVQKDYSGHMLAVAQTLLPDLTPESLNKAVELSAYEAILTGRERYQQRCETYKLELQGIMADPDFQQREPLLNPLNGSLLTQQQELQQRQGAVSQRLAELESPDFKWVYAKMCKAEEKAPSAFQKFMAALTFEKRRLELARQRCCEAQNASDFELLVEEFRQHTAELPPLTEALENIDQRITQLRHKVERYQALQPWFTDFEASLLQALQSELAAYFAAEQQPLAARQESFEHFAKTIKQPKLGLMFAKAHGLVALQLALQEIVLFIELQVRDRKKRNAAIQRTKAVWERKPWAHMTADKSKWLITLPQLKAESTAKQTRWLQQIIENFQSFSQWGMYYQALCNSPVFLPYDVFAWGASAPMPYDGFAQAVFTDVMRLRRKLGQQKPDYSALKTLKQKFKGQQKHHQRPGLDWDDDYIIYLDWDGDWNEDAWDEAYEEEEGFAGDESAEDALAFEEGLEIMDAS